MGARRRRPPVTRRSPLNGRPYTVGHGDDLGLDTTGDPWYTVCEDHGTLCCHETRKAAENHGPTMGWCEDCQTEQEAVEIAPTLDNEQWSWVAEHAAGEPEATRVIRISPERLVITGALAQALMALRRHPLAPTLVEFLAGLINQSAQRGSYTVCLGKRAKLAAEIGDDALAEVSPLVKDEDRYGHLWADVRDATRILKATNTADEIWDARRSYSRKICAKTTLSEIRMRESLGRPMTRSALLALSNVSEELLDYLVEVRLVETYRPAGKRSDWYRSRKTIA